MLNRILSPRTSIFTMLVVFSTALVAGVGYSQDQDGEVAIKVNDEVVKKSELEKQVDQTFQRMQNQSPQGEGMNQNEEMRDRVKDRVVEQQVEQLVLKTNAEKSDVSVDEEEIDNQLDAQKKRFEGEEQFQAVLEKQGMTVDDFRDRIRESLLVQKYLENEIGRVSIDDREVRQYYENNKEKFEESSFEEARRNIERILKQQKLQQKREKLVNKLRESSEVDIRV